MDGGQIARFDGDGYGVINSSLGDNRAAIIPQPIEFSLSYCWGNAEVAFFAQQQIRLVARRHREQHLDEKRGQILRAMNCPAAEKIYFVFVEEYGKVGQI